MNIGALHESDKTLKTVGLKSLNTKSLVKSNRTLWRRLDRYGWSHQLIRQWGTPFAKNLRTNRLWFTLSTVLAKSTNNAVMDPPTSTVEHHWCSIETKAWVVDPPRRAPNWLGSIVGRMMSRSQRPTMDSNTLASVGNNEIGRRSLSIDLGGLSLGIGITSADFHALGMYVVQEID